MDIPVHKVGWPGNASLMKKTNITVLSVVSLAFAALLAPISNASNYVAPVSYFKSGVCGLTVEDAHLSTYLLKMKKGDK